jgi:hypothetical protein
MIVARAEKSWWPVIYAMAFVVRDIWLELSPPGQCLFVSFQEQISVAPSSPV